MIPKEPPFTFAAVVTSHKHPTGLRYMLGNLRYQTRPPDETLVYCSETADLARFREDFPDVTFTEMPDLEDWGHSKRARGLQEAKSDFVGFFNDDDRYERDYIEQMMMFLERYPAMDAVFCSWNRIPLCDFGIASSTSGNFVVRANIGQEAGYRSEGYDSDGQFIERIKAVTWKWAKLESDRVLYFHNEGVGRG